MFNPVKDKSVKTAISVEMRRICNLMFNEQNVRGCLASNSISELINKNTTLEPVIKQYFVSNIEYFENILAIALEQGEIENCDLHLKALALQNMLIGLSGMSRIIDTEEMLWDTARQSLVSLGLYQD